MNNKQIRENMVWLSSSRVKPVCLCRYYEDEFVIDGKTGESNITMMYLNVRCFVIKLHLQWLNSWIRQNYKCSFYINSLLTSGSVNQNSIISAY